MAQAAAARPFARVTPLSMLQDLALVTVSGFFLLAHARNAANGEFASVPFVFEQALLVGMFLTRRRSIATSNRPLDWVVALGSWLPLIMRPAHGVEGMQAGSGIAVQTAGLVLVMVGFAYLGRSFGVVAANRGLKVNGPYRLVRHPIYFAHFVTMTGFLLVNPSAFNFALAAVTTACQVLRIQAEERLLSETDRYDEYKGRVRWRLIPGVW
jgi:protein-S-isoprenylcysteine O-methyltransferase Ste14